MADELEAAVNLPLPPDIPAPGRRLNVPLPPKLEVRGDIGGNWRKFKRTWDNYEIVTRLNEENQRYRTATLLTCIGPEALDLYDGLEFANENERHNIDAVLRKFHEFCLGEVNETYQSYLFHKRQQEPGESVDIYVAHLRKLIKTCNYGQLVDRLLKDQIVVGVKDEALRTKLLEIRDLTLRMCIDTCRAYEASQYHTKAMHTTTAHEDIHAVRRNKWQKRNQADKKPEKKGQQQKRSEKECSYCGKNCQPKACPAYGKLCNNCKKKNHFARVCKQKKQGSVHAMNDCELQEEEDDYVLAVENEDKYQRTICANMIVGGKHVNFQLDSGATTNVMSCDQYVRVTRDTVLNKLERTDRKLVMYNKTEIEPKGQRILEVRNPKNSQTYRVRFVIVGEECKPILGAKAVQHMRLITVNEENIAKIDEKDSSPEGLLQKFDDVFKGEGKLEGELHLETDKTVTPVKLPCRKWPLAIKENVRKELERLQKMEIIKPVDTPTDWISSIAVAMKPNGKVRLCIDPKPLNQALKRNEYPIPTIDDILHELQGAYYFTHLDAKNGFWHVVLDEESSFLTTFETPYGKYRWMRMPFGVSPAPEEFQRRINNALSGLNRVFAAHDDLLVWGKGETIEEASKDHDRNLENLLLRCREKDLKLNRTKVEFKKTQITYLGHVISKEGLKADPKKIDAIEKMPTPEDKAGVQRLMGMVGYLQKFAPNLSTVSAPLRELVKKRTNFRWDDHVHGKALTEIKKMLLEPPILKYFDAESNTTKLQADASEAGLGACLMQEGQPVQYASRALSDTEKGYAQIEKEMLAIVFGLERFERYVYGRHVVVETDHQPLVTIHRKSLLSAPKRLQRMLLRTQKYDYEVEYKKGKEMYLADTLSRAYLQETTGRESEKEEIFQTELEKEIETINMIENVAVTEECLVKLQESTKADEDLHRLMKVIHKGWPEEQNRVPKSLQTYHTFREELSVQNGLVFKGERIVVPTDAREMVLERLHLSHAGIQGCLRRARETVYWPNMHKDIENYVMKCGVCNTIQQKQPREPMISHDIPELPWQKIACDLFEYNKIDYLITVDFYSDFFEVDRLDGKASDEVIKKIKAHCARYGIPEKFITDNGPPFSSHSFADFMEKYGMEHITSSPGYAQSNGKAESAVKIAKNMLKKSEEGKTDPYLALLELRNIPSEKMKSSPVQRLFGRRTRTMLPIKKRLLEPEISTNVKEKLSEKKSVQISFYNRGTHELPPLSKGDIVRFQPPGKQIWVKAKVQNQVDVRSYAVRTEDGREYRRNRKHLRSSKEQFREKEKRPVISYQPRIERPTLMTAQQKLPEQSNQQQPALNTDGEKSTNETLVTPRSPQGKSAVPVSKSPKSPVKGEMSKTLQMPIETQMTTRGRVVKRPAYLRDYVS